MADSRSKGKRGEREIVAFYRELGYDAERTAPMQAGVAGGYADVDGVPGVHIEVKRQEALNIWKALAQAEAECGDRVPAVHFRRNGSDWYVALPLSDFAALLQARG